MSTTKQRDRVPCACGQIATVIQVTPYEFDERCRCGHEAWISYAHYKPPPMFTRTAAQLDLLRTA